MPDLSLPKPTFERRDEILTELERICGSSAFSHSRQAGRLLRYLVENSLDDQEDLLRERMIGVRLFGRDAKYDTNEDSIVRVSVADLRKRLARSYHELEAPGQLQFSIPVGSYRVEFLTTHAAPVPVVAPASESAPGAASVPALVAGQPRWRQGIRIGAVVAALVAVGWITYLAWPASPLDRFWGPASVDSTPVVILAPHPTVYTFSQETFRRMRGDIPSHAQRQMETLTGPPDAMIPMREVVPIRDQYIGLGSAHAISSISSLLALRKQAYQIRFGGDFSFQDIRHAPAVLIGAYANRWTMQLTDEMRFVLSDREGAPQIVDRSNGKIWALSQLRADGRTPEDYAIVSRVFHPKTGRILVALAGITQYGTQAAGEFVADSEMLRQATQSAPAGWEKGNVQFLLHLPIVEGVPGRSAVVAVHYW